MQPRPHSSNEWPCGPRTPHRRRPQWGRLPALLGLLLGGCSGGAALPVVEPDLQRPIDLASVSDGPQDPVELDGSPGEDVGQPAADLGRPAVDLGPRGSDLGPSAEDLGRPAADQGWPEADLGPAVADLERPVADLGQPLPDTGVLPGPDLTPDAGCQPRCGPAECGPDGCGGWCGPCPDGWECQQTHCVEARVCPVVDAPPPVADAPLEELAPPGRTETIRHGGFTDDYLYDGREYLKVGTRREWGATIIFFGMVEGGPGLNSTNVIDANDTGREVQIALYDPARAMQGCALDASCPAGACPSSITYLGWNPVQGGNECNRGSGVLSQELAPGRLAAVVQPLFWNPDWDQPGCGNDGCDAADRQARVSDVRYTQQLRFVAPHVVELSMHVENLAALDHGETLQEFPTLYASFGRVGPNLHRILDSEGQAIPVDLPANDGFFYRNFDSPRPFVSLQNDRQDYGVGIHYENRLTAFQAWQREGVFNNVRARFPFGLAAHGQVRARAYLILGAHATIVAEAEALEARLAPFGYLDTPRPEAQVAAGRLELAGWALDNRGVRQVELLLDGEVRGEAVLGDPRPDVCAVWPGYAECGRAGFHGVLDLTGESPCPHLLELRATDTEGNQRLFARTRLFVSPR